MDRREIYVGVIPPDIDLKRLSRIGKLTYKKEIVNSLVLISEKPPLTIDVIPAEDLPTMIFSGEMDTREMGALGRYIIVVYGEHEERCTMGKIESLAVRGVPTIFTDKGNLNDTIERIMEKYLKEDTREIRRKKSFTEYELAILMLTCIPTVGAEGARRLLSRFGSLERIVNADLQDLAEVLGHKKASVIYEFLHKKIEKKRDVELKI
ncbi:MAG: helix-hairpin-helix domain-containing protein [Candidatus Bathyarchaeia archaeon]